MLRALGAKTPADCCETDAQCLGKCDVCDVTINRCVKGVSGCCDSDSQCSGEKCRPGFCDLGTNTCQLSDKREGCCTSDAQCPPEHNCLNNVCQPKVDIPTVSQWGIAVMTLLLLVGGKIYFGRRITATDQRPS